MLNSGQEESSLKVNNHPIFNRIAEALGTKKAAQIAKALKVTPGAISQRRKDGDFSLAILLKTSQLSSVSIHWLQTGEGEKFISGAQEKVSRSWQKKLASGESVDDTALVRLPTAEHTLQPVPLIGTIAADSQQIVHPQERPHVMVPGILVREDTVLFRIDGNELASEGLKDGDLVLVREAKAIESFDNKIVIALIGGERVILRRHCKFGTMVHFSAIEGDHPIIRFPAENVEVKYLVTSITRAFE